MSMMRRDDFIAPRPPRPRPPMPLPSRPDNEATFGERNPGGIRSFGRPRPEPRGSGSGGRTVSPEPMPRRQGPSNQEILDMLRLNRDGTSQSSGRPRPVPMPRWESDAQPVPMPRWEMPGRNGAQPVPMPEWETPGDWLREGQWSNSIQDPRYRPSVEEILGDYMNLVSDPNRNKLIAMMRRMQG